MKKNINKIISIVKARCALFTNSKEIFYLTRAEFDGFWILHVNDKTYAICSKMIENQARDFFFDKGVDVYIEVPFHKAVLEILKKNNAKKLFVDPKYMTALDFIFVNEKLSQNGIEVEKKIGMLDSARMIKEDNEIENLKKSCKIVSAICDTVRKELKPGLTELDVHYKVLELFSKNHVTESFAPIIAFGKNSANPHHRSSDKKLIQNDIVMMDIGCVYNGYCSDLTRTYFLDKIDDNRKQIWNVVKRSQEAVLKGIKAGLPIAWADKTARSVIESVGYKDKLIHTTGHGVGIEIHEMPSLSSDAEGVFLVGMTVTVEPGIYIKQEFGIRIEDTILIKEDGCEVLTLATY
ncbi:MAG: M24 family metallopeptidase [Endomicrobium sp.]|jgi:Xaa-Pro aminopeptidase|nr:M24 family metallopeptidase [Endomicrobium sp.]